jgi:hypothetical protein
LKRINLIGINKCKANISLPLKINCTVMEIWLSAVYMKKGLRVSADSNGNMNKLCDFPPSNTPPHKTKHNRTKQNKKDPIFLGQAQRNRRSRPRKS